MVLAKRPVGEPDDSCFDLVDVELPDLAEGEILIKILDLSLDPYMRGRMNDAESYAAPTAIGEVMTGEAAGVVVESKSDKYAVGDYVTAYTGWQSHFIAKAEDPRSDPSIRTWAHFLCTLASSACQAELPIGA